MNSWKLTLEYDGSRYSGWAEQENAPRTVMGQLRKACEEVMGTRVDLMGAGRTDAGVHAAGQVAHLKSPARRTYHPEQLMRLLNDALPYDIAVLAAREVPGRFNARHDAIARAYTYQFATRKTAFSKKYVWWIKESLDVARMKEAASLIPGRHDFTCFRAKDPLRPNESPVVVVNSASIEVQDELLLFHIEASHFVWRMVRRLAGCLARVGMGEISVDDFRSLIDNKPNPGLDPAAWTAPSSGLFLAAVRYPAPYEE